MEAVFHHVQALKVMTWSGLVYGKPDKYSGRTCFAWLAWKIVKAAMNRSDEPAALGLKWLITLVLVGFWVLPYADCSVRALES